MKIGIVIGRFQVPVLHEGHRELLNHVLSEVDRLVVLLGVSPNDGYCAENPLSYTQRHILLQQQLMRMTGSFMIFPLRDQQSDAEWTKTLDAMLDALFPNDVVTLYVGRRSGIRGTL